MEQPIKKVKRVIVEEDDNEKKQEIPSKWLEYLSDEEIEKIKPLPLQKPTGHCVNVILFNEDSSFYCYVIPVEIWNLHQKEHEFEETFEFLAKTEENPVGCAIRVEIFSKMFKRYKIKANKMAVISKRPMITTYIVNTWN